MRGIYILKFWIYYSPLNQNISCPTSWNIEARHFITSYKPPFFSLFQRLFRSLGKYVFMFASGWFKNVYKLRQHMRTILAMVASPKKLLLHSNGQEARSLTCKNNIAGSSTLYVWKATRSATCDSIYSQYSPKTCRNHWSKKIRVLWSVFLNVHTFWWYIRYSWYHFCGIQLLVHSIPFYTSFYAILSTRVSYVKSFFFLMI